MDRVGIVSMNFYCATPNYGSTLQSYAIQTWLKKQGYDCEVISYFPHFRKNWDFKFPSRNYTLKKNPSAKVNFMLDTYAVNRKQKKFHDFVKRYIVKSEKNYSSDSFDTSDYDVFICGSDTIWNIWQTKGFERAFFGNFPCMKNCIAYAPSFGESIYNADEIKTFRKLLQNFSQVSVRERVNMEAFPDKGRKITEVLDPTLLLQACDYDRFAEVPRVKEKYVLIYALQYNKHMISEVKRFAQERKLKVIEVSWLFLNRFRYGNKMRYDAGIEEWLGLIKNAEYVFTNSFHGVVFSVIYRKEFYAYTRSDAKVKLRTICDKLGLLSRMREYNDGEGKDSESHIDSRPIDYDAVYSKLAVYRQESEEFLLNALQGIGQIKKNTLKAHEKKNTGEEAGFEYELV